MLYVIIGLLVAGALLGPLIAVLPSKRQRYLAAQREVAAAQGLTVRLRPLPEVPPRYRFEAPHEHMTYELRVDPRHASGATAGTYINGSEGWQALSGGERVPEVISAMPAGVCLVTVSDRYLAATWDESGGEQAVIELARLLGELHKPG